MGRKVAIITPYGLFNYGNRLQNWAVTRNLEARGLEPQTLILKAKYPTPVLVDLARDVGHRLGLRGLASRRYRRFLDFDAAMVKRRIYSEAHLSRALHDYDRLVIGSDQIWNPHQVKYGGAEFATGAPGTRKVALSPSFGISELPVDYADVARTELAEISHLSVREVDGQRIVRDLTGRTVPVLIDPALSLTSAEWRERSSRDMVPDEDFGFVYLLGNYLPERLSAIESSVRSKAGAMAKVYDTRHPDFYPSGPQDFVGLIAASSLVVTDSYHALLFGLLFGKPVHLVRREGKNYSMNSRFDTLKSLLNITFEESQVVPGAQTVVTDPAAVDEALEVRRREFAHFLDVALESEPEGWR